MMLRSEEPAAAADLASTERKLPPTAAADIESMAEREIPKGCWRRSRIR